MLFVSDYVVLCVCVLHDFCCECVLSCLFWYVFFLLVSSLMCCLLRFHVLVVVPCFVCVFLFCFVRTLVNVCVLLFLL